MTSLSAPKEARLKRAASISPDGSVPYTPTWGLAVPDAPGIYIINDLRGPLYVGKTNNLRRRFEEHHGTSHNPLLAGALRHPVGQTTFSWLLVAIDALAAIEAEVVARLQPLCNLTTPQPPRI